MWPLKSKESIKKDRENIWNVIETEFDGFHVCPVNEDGTLIVNHILTEYCPCEPRIEIHNGQMMIVHNYINFN